MASNATRAATHRRSLAAGLTVSAAAHAVALTVLSLPGGAPGDNGANASRVVDDSFEAIQVVQLAEQPPTPKAEVVERVANSNSQAASARTTPVPSATLASLDALLGQLEPAVVTTSIPESTKPVVTFRKLEAIAPSAATLAYGTGAFEEEETGGGGIGGLLGRIGAALSGAGHCPTADGPLILR